MSRSERTDAGRVEQSSGTPAWWVVGARELTDLWMGGKAPVLMLAFCMLQGGLTYFKVSDVGDPTPPKELVYFTLMNAVAVGMFMSLILGADSISGERERATLEALLLTPSSRRQIVVGKFLAACSPWAASFGITVPLLFWLAQGDEALGPALFWGGFGGTLLAGAFAALGMVVSFWSNSNRSSLFVSLLLYFSLLMPTMLPGGAQAGKFGRWLKRANPVESVGHWLEKVIVNNRNALEFSTDPRGAGWLWLIAPVIFAVVVFGILFLYAGPALALDAGVQDRDQ
jgi:ABC-type transport system involved in multi-copper enzyme maturation permease subunit